MSEYRKRRSGLSRQMIDATIHLVQKEPDKLSSQADTRLKYFENLIALIKVIIWPIIALILFISLHTPLMKILDTLPPLVEESTKLSYGDFSLEIEQRAIAGGYPELAEVLSLLSPEALEVLLQTSNGQSSLVSYSSDKQAIFFPSRRSMDGLVELAEKQLINFTLPLEDYISFKDSVLVESNYTGTDDRSAYTPSRTLSDDEFKKITTQRYELTPQGVTARFLIIQTVIQLLEK